MLSLVEADIPWDSDLLLDLVLAIDFDAAGARSGGIVFGRIHPVPQLGWCGRSDFVVLGGGRYRSHETSAAETPTWVSDMLMWWAGLGHASRFQGDRCPCVPKGGRRTVSRNLQTLMKGEWCYFTAYANSRLTTPNEMTQSYERAPIFHPGRVIFGFPHRNKLALKSGCLNDKGSGTWRMVAGRVATLKFWGSPRPSHLRITR